MPCRKNCSARPEQILLSGEFFSARGAPLGSPRAFVCSIGQVHFPLCALGGVPRSHPMRRVFQRSVCDGAARLAAFTVGACRCGTGVPVALDTPILKSPVTRSLDSRQFRLSTAFGVGPGSATLGMARSWESTSIGLPALNGIDELTDEGYLVLESRGRNQDSAC